MRPDTTEPFDSPLEEVLARMPEEEPPAALEERCLTTVRNLDSRERFARRRPHWKPVILAAAAGLAISFVGLATLLPNLIPAKRDMMAPPAGAAYERASSPLDDSGGLKRPETAAQALNAPDRLGDNSLANAKPETSPAAEVPAAKPATAAAPAAGPARQALNGPPSPGGPAASRAALAAPAAPAALPAASPGSPPAVEERGANTQRAETHFKVAGARSAPPPPPPDYYRPPPPASSTPAVEAGPEKPWYDTSPDRQKIVHMLLSLLVRDVQEAYDRSQSIIEDAKGFIEQDDLSLEKHGPREAHLSARIPTDKLKGVAAQLRDLGEVKFEKTESEDATREYRTQGAEIRDMGASEDDLVRRYLETKDPWTKRQLYQQIQDLRARNRSSKTSQLQLSEKTHLSYLELTLTEKTTPLKFLGHAADNLGAALGWIAVTAFLWLPLLVLVFVLWRRRGTAGA